MKTTILAVAALLATAPLSAQTVRPVIYPAPSDKAMTTTWKVDLVHSRLSFRVRHLVGKVEGNFGAWDAVIRTNGSDWTRGTADVAVKTATIATRNAQRDADLRSKRFFDVKAHPEMTFMSTGMIRTDDVVEMGGLLTIKGVTKPVVLRGLFLGRGKGADGRERMGFEASTIIKRKDFGLVYNDAIGGLPIVGDEATITIEIEAVRAN